MIRIISSLLFLPTLLSVVTFAQDLPIAIAEIQRDSEVDFAKEITPILKRNCLACHHEKEAEGGLILETIEAIHQGGDSGSSLDLNSPVQSLLLTRTTGEEEPLMPPEDNAVGAKTLTPEELGLIKRWIEQGAKGSEMLAEKIQWQEIPESIKTSFAVAMSPTGQFSVVGRGNRAQVIPLNNASVDQANEEASNGQITNLIDPAVPGDNAAHVDLVQSITIAPDGQRIATGGFRTVKLWKQINSPVSDKTNALLGASGLIALNEDQTLAAWVNPLGDIEVWNLADGSLTQVLSGHADAVSSLGWFSPKQIISAETSGRIILWQIEDGSVQAQVQSDVSIKNMSISGDGNLISAVSISGNLHRGTIDQENNQITISNTPVDGFSSVIDAQFLDAANLVVCDKTQHVSVLNQENQIVRKIDHGSPISAIAVSKPLKQLFTGGANGATRSWNLETGEPILTLQSDPQSQLLLAYKQGDSTRQNQKVDRLTKQTEELQKRLTSENEVLAKATEEQTKAKAALDEKEKGRADAATLVATTESMIQAAQTAVADAEKTTAEAQKMLTEATAKSELVSKEIEAETVQLGAANQAVASLKADLAAMQEKLKQAESTASEIQKKVDDKKAALEQVKQQATTAQNKIDTAAKTMTDSKAAIDKGTKDLEAQKKNLEKAQEEKVKSETELAKRQQAFETAKEAQNRAEKAIPEHQLLIAAETREKDRIASELEKTKSSLSGTYHQLTAIAVDTTSSSIATLHRDQSVRIYDLTSGEAVMRFTAQADSVATDSVHLCWVGDEVVAFGRQQPTQAWNTQRRWQLERTIGSPDDASVLSDRVTAMDFRNDGLSLAVGSGSPSRAGEVKVFSVETGRLIRDFGDVHSDSVLGLRFSPRGGMIASSAADKTVRLLDLATGSAKRSLEGHTHHVLAIAWQDDEQTLASASADKTIKIWDIETGEQRRTITGFGKEITAIDYVSATNQLITACADGQARLYDTSNGKSLRSFNASGDFLYSLSLSLDGKQLLASGQSGVLRLWNVEDGKLITEWK
ncbi:MAG: c-type cytochrome domain-containing protein [Rubripirellula sp.]